MGNFNTEKERFLKLKKALSQQINDLNNKVLTRADLDSFQKELGALQSQTSILSYLQSIAEEVPRDSAADNYIEKKESAQVDELIPKETSAPIFEEDKTIVSETILDDSSKEHIYASTPLSEEKEEQALADQFMNKGISNLIEHIGISEKFMFIHELFKGDTEQYIKELNKLDNCKTAKEANERLQKKSTSFNWDEESHAYLELKKLIDRKYPA